MTGPRLHKKPFSQQELKLLQGFSKKPLFQTQGGEDSPRKHSVC